MDQFDVAATLYREDPVALYYLDHDPVVAARSLCDTHVRAGPNSVVQLLSSAWHQHNPWFLALDGKHPYAGLFTRRVPPPLHGQRTLQPKSSDPFYVEYSGDRPFTMLMGQTIGEHGFEHHPNAEWVRGSAGNYYWAHAYGVELCHEHRYRFGTLHPALPKLWTLEAPPPDLDCDSPQAEPTPEVPGDCLVLIDGQFYDAIASYGQLYSRHKRAILNWTRRAAPPWLVV